MRHSGSNSETELAVIKQEENFNKDFLYGNDNATRSECAQVNVDLSCRICAVAFNTKEALLEHERRLSYHCEECKKCFKKEVKYWTHMVRVHPPPPDSESDTDPSLCCANCKFTFLTQISFDRHMAVIHQTATIPLDQLKIVQDDISPTVNAFNYCTRCHFTFIRKNDFFIHLVRIHGIDMELDPYPIKMHHPELVPDLDHPHHFCNACEYTFRNKDNFLQHLLKQHNIPGLLQQQDVVEYNKPKAVSNIRNDKRCETCKLTFTSRSSYLRHLGSMRHGYILASSKVQTGKVNQRKSKVASKRSEKKLKDTVAQLLQQLDHKQKPQNGIVSNLLEQLQQHRESESEQEEPDEQEELDGDNENKYEGSTEQHQPYVEIERHILPKPLRSKNPNIQPDIHNTDNFCTACEYATAALYNDHLESEHRDAVTLPACLDLHNPMIISIRPIQINVLDGPDINDTDNRHLEYMHNIVLSDMERLVYDGKKPDNNDPNHHCAACEKTFAQRRNYITHLNRIHGVPHNSLVNKVKYDGEPDINNPDNTCTACERTYRSARFFKNHLVRVHWKYLQKANKASSTVTASSIVNSITGGSGSGGGGGGGGVVFAPDIHESDNKCNVCDRQYHSKRNFRIHLMNEHGLNVPEAEQPETEDNLPKHKIRRTDPPGRKTYTCDTCQDTFRSDRDYRYHKVRTHGAEPREQKIFWPIWINLKDTPDLNGPTNTCTACKREYSSQRSLRTHLVNIHHMKLPDSPSKLQLTIHQRSGDVEPDVDDARNWCASCDRVYSSKYNYRNHLRIRHRMDLPTYSVQTDPDVKNGQQRSPSQKVKKVTHIAGSRVSSRVVKHSCSECDTTYLSKRELLIHMKFSHDIEKPVNSKRVLKLVNYNENVPDIDDASNWCKVCDKVFGNRQNYRNHLSRAHHVHIVVKEEDSVLSQEELTLEKTVAKKSRRNKKRKVARPRKPASQKQKVDVTEMQMLQCEECWEKFDDNLLYQVHLVEGHDRKRPAHVHKQKKNVQWDLSQDDE
ncbi:hypothetical protein MFLAVUS_010755 [Mucor flavus]|uniref:C2H2-type domain-containing protein n=1 Tax=Mucor flavus TaxID=439312 RepID=A0ABP9ZDP8_9FUNG